MSTVGCTNTVIKFESRLFDMVIQALGVSRNFGKVAIVMDSASQSKDSQGVPKGKPQCESDMAPHYNT